MLTNMMCRRFHACYSYYCWSPVCVCMCFDRDLKTCLCVFILFKCFFFFSFQFGNHMISRFSWTPFMGAQSCVFYYFFLILNTYPSRRWGNLMGIFFNDIYCIHSWLTNRLLNRMSGNGVFNFLVNVFQLVVNSSIFQFSYLKLVHKRLRIN